MFADDSSIVNSVITELDGEAVEKIISPTESIDYHSRIASILENTTEMDKILQYIDKETLVKEFSKIRNHMSHGTLEESNRPYWEEQIAKIIDELGMEENGPSLTKENPERSESSTDNQETTTEVQKQKERRKMAQKLSRIRRKKDLSRNKLAQRSDLDLHEIAEIEKGRQSLSYEILQSYADGLNMELQFDFKEKQSDGEGDLLERVKHHLDEQIEQANLTDDEKQHCRIVLHQLAEDGLYNERFSTVIDLLNYLETATKEFSIQDDQPKKQYFTNPDLFDLMQSLIEPLELTDMAYDEKIKIITQKALENLHKEKNSES